MLVDCVISFEGSGADGLSRLAMTKVSVSKYLGGEGTALAVKQASGCDFKS